MAIRMWNFEFHAKMVFEPHTKLKQVRSLTVPPSLPPSLPSLPSLTIAHYTYSVTLIHPTHSHTLHSFIPLLASHFLPHSLLTLMHHSLTHHSPASFTLCFTHLLSHSLLCYAFPDSHASFCLTHCLPHSVPSLTDSLTCSPASLPCLTHFSFSPCLTSYLTHFLPHSLPCSLFFLYRDHGVRYTYGKFIKLIVTKLTCHSDT